MLSSKKCFNVISQAQEWKCISLAGGSFPSFYHYIFVAGRYGFYLPLPLRKKNLMATKQFRSQTSSLWSET